MNERAKQPTEPGRGAVARAPGREDGKGPQAAGIDASAVRPRPFVAAADGDDHFWDRLAPAQRHQAMLALQRTLGNAAVQRQLSDGGERHPGAPVLQRAPAEPRSPLDQPTKDAVLARLKVNLRQEAIDLVVAYSARKGEINPSLLDSGRMTYDDKLAGREGDTTPPDRSAYKGGTPPPIVVGIGPTAFDTAGTGFLAFAIPWLYSTIMHEYKHVVQYQDEWHSRNVNKLDTETYLTEILNAKITGVFAFPNRMEDLWTRLNDNWAGVAKADKKNLRARYLAAYKMVAAAVPFKSISLNDAKP